MKYSTAFLMLSIYASSACAIQQVQDILLNKEVELCISKYGENNDECLSVISDSSEASLKLAYRQKYREIESFDHNQWWMGSKEQKQQMLASFASSQKLWINYRDVYCQTATTGAQETHDSGNAVTSYYLNMNTRRIEEIRLIKPSAVAD